MRLFWLLPRECGKVRPFARPSGDLACGRHSSLSNRADAFNSVFERRRTGNAKRHRKENRVRPRIWVHRRRRWQGVFLPSEWRRHLPELRQPARRRGRQLRHRAEPEGTAGESRSRRLGETRHSPGAPGGTPLFYPEITPVGVPRPPSWVTFPLGPTTKTPGVPPAAPSGRKTTREPSSSHDCPCISSDGLTPSMASRLMEPSFVVITSVPYCSG